MKLWESWGYGSVLTDAGICATGLISWEVLVGKKRFLLLRIAQINGVTERRGCCKKKTEDGVQVMVSQLEWTFRSRSAHNVSYSHHRHGGVTHKGQVTASARQNKKWASLQGDRSATSARTHTRLGALDPSLFVQSLPPIGRCSEDDHTCSAYTDMRTEALMFLARTEEPKVAQSSLFPFFFLIIIGRAERNHTGLDKAIETWR